MPGATGAWGPRCGCTASQLPASKKDMRRISQEFIRSSQEIISSCHKAREALSEDAYYVMLHQGFILL